MASNMLALLAFRRIERRWGSCDSFQVTSALRSWSYPLVESKKVYLMVELHSEGCANNVTQQRAVYDLLPAVSRP